MPRLVLGLHRELVSVMLAILVGALLVSNARGILSDDVALWTALTLVVLYRVLKDYTSRLLLAPQTKAGG